MKTLLSIAAGLFFFISAHAQIQTPVKTLNCTEEAITFKASIRSGWRINSFRIGNMAPAKMMFDYMPEMPYPMKALIAEMSAMPGFQNSANPGFPYIQQKKTLQQQLTFKFYTPVATGYGFPSHYNTYSKAVTLPDSSALNIFTGRQALFATK
jgi:hypothetical protein